MPMKYLIFFIAIFIYPVLVNAQVIELDTDNDGLTDQQEINIYFTDPKNADSDGDTFSDGEEVKNNYSPLFGDKKKLIQVDSDKDYLNDAWEIILGTGLMNPDTDGDKFLDGTEVAAGYDPLDILPNKLPKLIKVNLAKQNLEYTFGDKVLGNFAISSGLRNTPTPKGNFTVLSKIPVKRYAGTGYNYPNTKWNLNFKSGYYIHGAYWHNKFGQPMSHGCVNVAYEDMEALYWWAQVGTPVIIK
jgi:lipoprotein-anchoring transpeptidase ErfK/SrfK